MAHLRLTDLHWLARLPHRGLSLRFVVGILILFCLLAGTWYVWYTRPLPQNVAAAPGARGPASPRLENSPMRVSDHIYMLGDLFPAAVYVVQTSQGLVFIDSGMDAEYDVVVNGMSKLGLDLGQLKMILLTHIHGDHSMGAQRLRRQTGARVFIGQADAALLRAGGPWEAIFSKFDMGKATAHPTDVDVELEDGQALTLGEARFSCIATPGHTPGSFCFLLEMGRTRALFTGDTVMSLSQGTGTYPADLPPRYRGDLDAYLRSLQKLSSVPAPDLVLPGHPRDDPTPLSAALTPKQWKTLLGRGISELNRWSARHAKDGADFLDGTPRQLADGLYYLGDPGGRACYALCAKSWSLLFDAPGGDDAADLIESAWRYLGVSPPPLRAVLLTSCDHGAMSGLGSVIARTGCQVVASPRGEEKVSRLCPPGTNILSARDLAPDDWEGIEAFPLRGLNDTAIGYKLARGEDAVLVSGLMPIECVPGDISRLREAASLGIENLNAFHASLKRLAEVKPNLWLTSAPMHGRNANLYGDDWSFILRFNAECAGRSEASQEQPARSADE